MNGRLWVTGLGLVTPLGASVEATWERLVRGERSLRPVTLFDTDGQRGRMGGQVDGVDLPPGPPEVVAGWSRTSVMAASAAEEAMRMAHLSSAATRVGLVIAGSTGGMFETEHLLAKLHRDPACGDAMLEMLSHPLTATGERLDERLGPFARVRTLSSACSSGSNALVVAAGWLLAGEVDAVVAGGSDGLCRLTVSGFNAIAAIDPEPCRPFDRRRRGTNLGEGAGFLVLERADTACSRGAEPIAELAGWAIGSEAHHITNPASDGAVVASLIERALARAGLDARAIDYVNAHGTGTLANDRMEAAALARALGDEVRRVPVSSSKAQIGHTLAAAGAIEAAFTAIVVARRTLVPTAVLDEPYNSLGLLHVPNVSRPGRCSVRAALSNAFGFGGMDTVARLHAAGSRGEARGHGGQVVDARLSPRGAAPAVVVTGAAVFGPCGRVASEGCAALPEGRFDSGAVVDPDPYLDPERARRLDRVAQLGAVAVEHALNESGASRDSVGVLLGRAFGSADASAAFLDRALGVERGPRSASPAEFPNLVPSAPVGHISIYGNLHGPTFATADLAASGESAVIQGCQLIAAGEAVGIAAGSAEPRGDIVDRVLSPLFGEARTASAARVDLAAAVVLEAEGSVRARGGRVLARIEQVLEWRGHGSAALADLRAPRDGRRGRDRSRRERARRASDSSRRRPGTIVRASTARSPSARATRSAPRRSRSPRAGSASVASARRWSSASRAGTGTRLSSWRPEQKRRTRP